MLTTFVRLGTHCAVYGVCSWCHCEIPLVLVFTYLFIHYEKIIIKYVYILLLALFKVSRLVVILSHPLGQGDG